MRFVGSKVVSCGIGLSWRDDPVAPGVALSVTAHQNHRGRKPGMLRVPQSERVAANLGVRTFLSGVSERRGARPRARVLPLMNNRVGKPGLPWRACSCIRANALTHTRLSVERPNPPVRSLSGPGSADIPVRWFNLPSPFYGAMAASPVALGAPQVQSAAISPVAAASRATQAR